MKIGRNDPCPCGSGKKYKRCCMVNDEAAQTTNRTLDNEWLKLRQTEGEMVHLLLHVARDWYGEDFLKHAWQEYTRQSSESLKIGEAPETDTSFIPWAVFDYVPPKPEGEADSHPKLPVALSFLFTSDDEPTPDQREFIIAMYEQPYSFWSVQEAAPGKSLKLRDLFAGAEYTVKELKASDVLKKGDIVYTRVVSKGPTAIMVGMAPFFFPPNYHFDFLEAREMLFGRRRKIAPKELLPCEALLRELYFALRHRRLNPVLPVLQNTDGDPLEFVKLTYDLKCAPQEAYRALRSFNPVESEEEILADATYDKDGELQTATFSWMKIGNEKHPDWDNTVLGNIRIENQQLVIEVNSSKRSEKIKKEIGKLLGDNAVLVDSVTESVEERLAEARNAEETEEQRRAREENEALNALPEVQAQMKTLAKQHWDNWLDVPVPLLKRKTPRQAARTVAGRERLEALLIDFERKGEIGDDAFAPNVAELRNRLGLTPGAVTEKAKRNQSPASPNKASQSDGVPLYQLKITLKHFELPIWRRIMVRSDMKLNRLHGVIQCVMGWTDSHLHHFFVGRTFYGTPDPDMWGIGPQTLNEKRYTVADLAPEVKRSFVYEYDFGDSWEHKIVLEKILPPDPAFKHPVCLAGANASPPEDCGGIPGFYNLLEILANPHDEEHDSMKEWLGYDLDPAHFDLESANVFLSRLKA